LDEELRAYQEMAAEENVKQGTSRQEALRAVRLERGSLEIAKEVVRSGSWECFLETSWQDLRFAVRILRSCDTAHDGDWNQVGVRGSTGGGPADGLASSSASCSRGPRGGRSARVSRQLVAAVTGFWRQSPGPKNDRLSF